MNIITAHTGMKTWDGVEHWVPPTKKSWDWYTGNRDGDVHIFEDVHLPEHVNYNGKVKIALLEEVPTIYDYAGQFDPNMFHPYKWLEKNHQHFDYIFGAYRFMEEWVGKDRFHWIYFCIQGIAPNEFGMYDKERNLSIIASPKRWTTGHQMRHQIIAKYGDKIDVYGKGYNNLLDQYDPKGRGKIIALAPYRFTLIIPNTVIDDWFSEQVTDAMAVGTIPVFCGTKNIGKFFNTDGMVLFDSVEEFGKILPTLNKDLYDLKINGVLDNLERARTYKTTVDWIYDNKKDFLENIPKKS